MSPLPHPIPLPALRSAGAVGIRGVRMRDAEPLRRLLAENRHWLEPWEASYPGTNELSDADKPGASSMRPVVRAMHSLRRAGSSVTFVIVCDGETVGQLSISDIAGGALRSASIGYWIAEGFAGQGITPMAVALAIDYSFFELRLHRVEICIRPENVASLRVVEKLGLRYEGRRGRYIYIAGAWRDHDSFAVTAEEAPGGLVARLTG